MRLLLCGILIWDGSDEIRTHASSGVLKNSYMTVGDALLVMELVQGYDDINCIVDQDIKEGFMRLIKRVLLLLALLMPLSVWAADTETLINYADDPATTGKVKAALAKDTRLSALDIKVKSDDLGAVHLSGSAKSQAEISQAVIVARSVSGVVSVQNDIVIDAPDSVKTK